MLRYPSQGPDEYLKGKLRRLMEVGRRTLSSLNPSSYSLAAVGDNMKKLRAECEECGDLIERPDTFVKISGNTQ